MFTAGGFGEVAGAAGGVRVVERVVVGVVVKVSAVAGRGDAAGIGGYAEVSEEVGGC